MDLGEFIGQIIASIRADSPWVVYSRIGARTFYRVYHDNTKQVGAMTAHNGSNASSFNKALFLKSYFDADIQRQPTVLQLSRPWRP